MNSVFNRNRYLSLVIMIIGGLLGWYSIILITNKITDKLPIPDKTQIWGFPFGIVLSFFIWLQRCYTIKIR